MDNEYSYDGKLWRPCATMSDENSFFHSAFGVKTSEREIYFDKHANFRRRRWLTCLTYFENEAMPTALANTLVKYFSTNNKYKHRSIKDRNHIEEYVLDIMAGQYVTKEEIPILSALENIQIALLSNEGPDPLVVVNPIVDILGKYSNVLEKPKEQVVLCLVGHTFFRLEPVNEYSASKPVELVESQTAKDHLQSKNCLLRYPKGGCAGSKGVEFQVRLLTVLLLNSMRRLQNWKLSTENKKAGKFDDAVVEWPEGAILIQAKHKENTKKISCEELLSANTKNHDFSLPKYYLSYQEIKTKFKQENIVVICTNAGVHERALEFLDSRRICSESMLYCADDDYSFYTFNLKILPSLKQSVAMYLEKHCQDKNIDPAVLSEENLKDFLKRLQIYSSYPLGGNTEKVTEKMVSILKFFENVHNQISFSEIHAKVMEWFQRKQGIYLTDFIANAMFLEIKSDRYLQKLEEYNVLFQENLLIFPNKAKLYCINVEGRYLVQELQLYHLFRTNKSKLLYANPENGIELQQIIEAFEIPIYTILILSCSKDIIKEFEIRETCSKLTNIFNQYKEKKVFLLTESNHDLVELDRSIICNIHGSVTLKDLSCDSQVKLLQKKVIFQGTEVSLQELFESQTNVCQNELSSEILEKLIRGEQINVGLAVRPLNENIMRYYIDRTFKREIKQTSKKNEEAISEQKLYELDDKVVLIADAAGMGKSTVLSHLAVTIKKKNPHMWVLRIALSDYTKILKEFKERNKTINILELLNFKNLVTNQLENIIFSMDKKVVILIDGVDEISPDYTELIVRLLDQCQEGSNFHKVFVTTRPNMIQQLESMLFVKPFTLLPFTERNQICFLTNYWAHNLKLDDTSKKKCEEYARKLLSTTSSWTQLYQQGENHFAAIPLQIRMLADIFQSNDGLEETTDWHGCNEYLKGNERTLKFPEKSNITKMYKLFIEKKRSYFTNRENPSGNPTSNEALVNQFEDCLTYHRILALEEILRESECKLFSNYHQADMDKETMILKMGIILKSGDNFHFVHRTFAEYFVADCIQREFEKLNQNPEFQKFFIDEILMNMKYRIVRAFLDSFLQNIVDYLPSNIFQNYQSLRYNIDVKLIYNLIHQLAKEGCVAILNLLFKCIDFEFVKNEVMPVYVYDNNINVLQSLVKNCGVNVIDRSKLTPLSCAVQNGHLEMVKFLVEHGASIETRDSQGRTVLYVAICLNHVNIAAYLLDKYLEVYGLNGKYPIIPYALAYLGQLKRLEEFIRHFDINITGENGETLIFGAARGGRIKVIRYLLRHEADINITDEEGNTALHVIAIKPDSVSIAKVLVEFGIDVNVKNFRGNTALHLATNSLAMTEFLVKKGADVNSRNESGATPVCLAASSDHLDTVKFLIEHGSDIHVTDNGDNTLLHSAVRSGPNMINFLVELGMDVNVKNNYGYLPLHKAVLEGQLETVKFFIENGVDVNARDNLGNTALYLAAWRGHRHIIECLVEREADSNISNADGLTALHIAARSGHLDTVKLFVDIGANINLRTTNGCTALHLSALNSKWHIAKFLVECDSNLNLGVIDRETLLDLASRIRNIFYSYGQGSLHIAALNGKLHIIKLLLELGVNINIIDNNGCTPLHLASCRQLNSVKFLIHHGADINIKDNTGLTALHHAFCSCQRDVIKFFFEQGINMNVTDNDGSTVLHYAACSDQWDIIEFILEGGMDVNVRNVHGQVPLQFAIGRCSLHTINSLLERGADVHNKDKEGRTALHVAASRGNLEAVKFLVARDVDVSGRDNYGRTALHSAVSDTVSFLVNLGLEVNATDVEGRTALHCAAEKGQLDTVKTLVSWGSNHKIRDNDGSSALLIAAARGRWQVVEFLMQLAFDVNTTDINRRTVLHFAALNGQLSIVKHVLERGGDVNSEDQGGRTALHLAALQDSANALGSYSRNDQKAYWSIVKLLVKYGADIGRRDSERKTAAMLAEEKGNYHLIQYLEPQKIK